MVTTAEAKASIVGAEQTISVAEKSLVEQERELQRITRPEPVTIGRQISLARQVGVGGVSQEVKRIRAEKEQIRFQQAPRFLEAERQISLSKEEIATVKASNEAIARQNKIIRERNQDIQVALKLFRTGRSVGGESSRVKRFVQKLQQGQELLQQAQIKKQFATAGLVPVFDQGVLRGFEDVQQQMSFGLEALGGIGQERLSALEAEGLITIEERKLTQPEFLGQITAPAFLDPSQFKMSIREEKTSFQTLVSDFSTFASKIETPSLIGIGPIGFRPEEIVEVSARVTKEFIPSTKEEVISTGLSFAIGGGIGFGLKGAGAILTKIGPRALKTGELVGGAAGLGLGGFFAFEKGSEFIAAPTPSEKGAIVGTTARELLSFGLGLKVGTKGFTTIQGLVRTRGFTELPIEPIIAPEFFEGATFPRIKPGQTAGELRTEFFAPVVELGEVGGVARGFTAMPFEVKPEVGKGSSFVFGQFSAPRISPFFLKVKGGEESISFFKFRGFLDPGKPTIARTTFEDIGFAPGVTAGTPRPSGKVTQEQLEFFGGGLAPGVKRGKPLDLGEPKAPKGQAFIPFVKTEKEAVTPFGTLIRETGRKFFIKFEGRRIPIVELKTIPEPPSGLGIKTGGKTIGEVLASSSRIPESSLITPEIGGISFIPSSRGRGLTDFSTSFIPSVSRKPFRTPTTTSLITILETPRRTTDIKTTFTDLPSTGRLQPGRPKPSIPVSVMTTLPEVSKPTRRMAKKKARKKAERKPIKKKKKARRKFTVPTRPSFTAIVLDIEPAAQVTEKFGVLPGTIRGLRTGFKVPKKEVKKKK